MKKPPAEQLPVGVAEDGSIVFAKGSLPPVCMSCGFDDPDEDYEHSQWWWLTFWPVFEPNDRRMFLLCPRCVDKHDLWTLMK